MKGVIACYVRVSTTGQSLDVQKAEIKKWLKGEGFSLRSVRWFEDKKTGDNLDRPGFQAMEKAIFDGEIKTVVVWKLDRISRKIEHGIRALHEWLDKGIRFVSTTQQFDFKGALGKTIASLLFGLAEMEQEVRRERQAVGIAKAKAAGKYKGHGRKPGATKAKPKRALELREEGKKPAEIARFLGVSRSTVYEYFKAADS
jgi:DNA invertase Pin-like site-specific DNA recombinase